MALHELPEEVRGTFARYTPFRNRKLQVFLSLKAAGDMSFPDGAGRKSFFRQAGVDPASVRTVSQVHSRNCVALDHATNPLELRKVEADGVCSNDLSLVPAVTVADCVPIFFYDKKRSVFAAIHSGWKGTGIVIRMLDLMRKEWDCRPEDVEAFIGPSIRSCCYRVDQERAADFRAAFGSPSVREEEHEEGPHFFLDLPGANEKLLYHAGIASVKKTADCTCCDSRFGSYRREGSASFTRMLALIALFK
jgi:polyphenol oxidase